jgi:pyruvyltransferase
LVVRTYFWQPPTHRRFLRKRAFRVGNAGDSFVADLVRWRYGSEPHNVDAEGKRILLVGSVAHRAEVGDVLAGVGLKSSQLAEPWPRDVLVHGVRGPRTLAALRAHGAEISDRVWLGDPGLLIGRVFEELAGIEPVANRISFIPHYRERSTVRLPKHVTMIDIDDEPRNVGRQIAESELVYASSLHGIIWAHALKRPVMAVRPQTEESEFKYLDYFDSVNRPYSPAATIEDALTSYAAPTEIVDVEGLTGGIDLPSIELLRERGAA